MSEQQQQRQGQQQAEDPYARQAELSAIQQADQIAARTQHQKVAERKFNPGFFAETSKLDADSELYDWLENELGAKASRAHTLGHREEHFGEQQELLNANEAERMIAEREPGRLLKKNPVVLAVYQGVDSLSDPDAVAPIEHDRERRQYRDVMELATTHESLAIEGRYLDALTKATTETSHRDRVEDEASGTTKRLRGVFK